MRTILFVMLLVSIGCSKERAGGTGTVSGVATNARGTPLPGTKIIIDNSVFFNTNLIAATDNAGKYSLKVPTGSWYAFAVYETTFHDKKYRFYLHPDNEAGFGGEGAVRNFTWKLTGEKAYPLSGHYGGLVTIDHYPGFYINANDIEFTLTPQSGLIDGSEAGPLALKAPDGYQLKDLPIGRYKLTASYNGSPLKLRKWNTDDVFETALEFDFEPQIDGQCDNCFKIEYNQS